MSHDFSGFAVEGLEQWGRAVEVDCIFTYFGSRSFLCAAVIVWVDISQRVIL